MELDLGAKINNTFTDKTLDELLELYDEEFVRAAYQLILNRDPDPEGFQYYLNRIRKGISKLDILGQLRRSTEGKKFSEPLEGLDKVVRQYQRTKWPIVGRLFINYAKENQIKLQELENKIYTTEKAAIRRFNYLVSVLGHLQQNNIDLKEKSTEQEETPSETITDMREAKNDLLVNMSDYEIVRQSGLFDFSYYLETYPDITLAGIDPLQHYLDDGWRENRNPNNNFDTYFYLTEYLDVKKAGVNPLIHYIKYGKNEGRITNKSSGGINLYQKYTYSLPIYTDAIQKEIECFIKKPLLSIVMPVYNVDPKWLDFAIKSIEAQWYTNWELCIADDKSSNVETLNYLKSIDNTKIKIIFLEQNINISGASNEALKLAKGEYVVLMDNDDEITPDALYEVVKIINNFGAEFIYSDEDKLEMDGTFTEPHFKPDYSPDMFMSHNYMSHLAVIEKKLLDKVNGWEIGLEGAQDYDLYLKTLEHTNKIFHIPKVLYHWRKIPGSTAAVFSDKSYANEAGRKALENALKRRNIDAKVVNGLALGTYRISYKLLETPLISIIIPFKDKPELLRECINSILKKSTYVNFEIIGISNNSSEKSTFTLMKQFESIDSRIKFYEYNVPFNYSEINNYAVEKYARGKHLVFLNNDIEIITPDWIESMLEFSQRKDVGTVGAKLYFPNNTIQHAGIVIAPMTSHAVISMYQKCDREIYGHGVRAKCINNYLALTAACLMCKKELFNKVGGFDKNLAVAYNDIDLCLRIYKEGYFNVFTPYAEAYHHESVSRGHDTTIEKHEKREREKFLLKRKHPEFFEKCDPFYNINLTMHDVNSAVNELNSVKKSEFIGLPFEETIFYQKVFFSQNKNKICLFSHYDKYNIIEDYVLHYLKELNRISDIIFISTAENLSEEEVLKIKSYCNVVIIKKNVGYDFGAWKTGINFLGDQIDKYDQLILCNDSCYGPFYELNTIFNDMENKKYDIWSMTDSLEISKHLQSFFIVYNKNVINSKVFKDFWENFRIYINKFELIKKNEIGFSTKLFNTNFRLGAVCSSEDYSFLNITHFYWKDLIVSKKFPFIKKELLRDNPMNLDISNWENVIKSTTKYDCNLIKKSLKK